MPCKRAAPPLDLDCRTPEWDWFRADDAGNIDEVDRFVQNFRGRRHLHCLDLFSATAIMATTWASFQYLSKSCDFRDTMTNYDVTSRAGFFETLELALSVVEYGFAMAGPPCSMFVFLSSGVHKRTAAQPSGDQSHKKVRLANLVASNALSIMKIMAARRVFVMIEQPLNSLMYHYEPFATWVAGNPSLFFVVTYMQAFGHDMVKPTKLLTNMKSARLLTRQRPARRLEASSSCESGDGQPGRKYLRMCPSGPSGDRDLQSSASYTQDFAQAVFFAWEHEYRRGDHMATLYPVDVEE